MSTSDNTLSSSTLPKNSTTKILPYQCRVCRAPAEYSYFGVISCQSCKMFFKRNADSTKIPSQCVFDGHCEININNRHTCTSCRLAKCFQCGMTTDKFRPSRQIKSKPNALVKVQHQPVRLRPLNLLESDQSLLTTSQWTLLSNLCHGYKESNLLSLGLRLIDTHNTLQTSDVISQAPIAEFLASIYETAGEYLRSNDDFCGLLSDDRSVLLHSAAKNVVCTSAAFATHHCHLLSFDNIFNAMVRIYGKRTVDIHLWAMKFIDPDIVLTKLAVSLFAFSEITYSHPSNVPTELTNSLLILEIQNKYAEVTWKYLLYKYGHHQAVKRFLNLTAWFIALIISLCQGESSTTHLNNVKSLVEETEIKLILDDVDRIIETD